MNGLNEQQLDSPVRWMGDERGGTVKVLHVYEEDMLNDDGQAIERSAFTEEEATDLKVAYPKGTPVLEVDL
ncbi:hypothetical protein [Tellurirhabdus bombi]|uniref:hypothetical protein n=1 Tax=Tellurirhabdus bombi TaxID=2907205 RepID=UPI001F180183|nr:hypothetical protein [Tellurirhabdus bombi]